MGTVFRPKRRAPAHAAHALPGGDARHGPGRHRATRWPTQPGRSAIPFLLAGIGNTIILVVIFTVYVKVTPGEYLGRIIGVHITAGTASMVLSFLLSGPLIETLGVRGAFRLEAVGVTAVLILGAIPLRPLIAAPRAIAAEVTVPPAAEER